MKDLVCKTDNRPLLTHEELEFIYVDEFKSSIVASFYKEFLKLNSDPKVKVIPVVISSYGGQVHALLAMLDIMASATKPVATIALGKAMSCGIVLLSAGTKGYRYAAPSADIMIHQVSSMGWGKTTDLEASTDQTKYLNKVLMERLAKHAKKPKNYFIKKIKGKSNADWHLEAEECKRLGLVDHVGVPNLVKGNE